MAGCMHSHQIWKHAAVGLTGLNVGLVAQVTFTQGGQAVVEKPHRERWASTKAGETEARQARRQSYWEPSEQRTEKPEQNRSTT